MCGLIALGILVTTGFAAERGPEAGWILDDPWIAAHRDGWVTEQTAEVFLYKFNRSLANGELDELSALFAPDVQRRSPAGSQSGREKVRAHYERMLKRFATLSLNPRRLIADGYSAVCECQATALHRATGNRVELPLAVMITFDAEGQVTRFYEYYDTADFRSQLQ